MRKGVVVLVVALLAAGLSGCAQRTETRVADFSIVATRLVDLGNIEKASRSNMTRGVVGQYLITAEKAEKEGLKDAVKLAMDDAITKANGDMMVNCILYYIVEPDGDKVGYKVKGDVIQTMGAR